MGLNVNPISNKEESYYVLSNQLQNKQDIYKYAFTLQTLKQLTDKLPNKNQLIVFDTGLGSVIQNDFANNFFSSNIAEASFTQKNRIIICPENFSAETTDKKDDTRKGDLVRIITSVPEQFNILNLFVDSVQREHTNNTYKKTMQYLWEQQACCVTTLKIIREKEYFTYLTAFNNNIALSTRSSLKPSAKKHKPIV